MSEFSYPFDGGPGATITEDQWSYMASSWQDDGVLAEGPWDSPLKVTSAGESLILHVAAGRANIAGFHFHMDAARTISFTSNSTAFVRKDLLVLKLNRTTNTISFVYKTGTPSASPISPPIYLGWDSPEIFLATITVLAGASTVSSGNVSDDRDFVGRRVQMARNASGLPRGSVSYNPDDDSVYVTKNLTIDALATDADLTAHAGATNPHTQYMRNNTTIGNVTLTNSAVINNYAQASIYRCLGNVCHLALSFVNASGSTISTSVQLGSIPTAIAPLYTFYAPAVMLANNDYASVVIVRIAANTGQLFLEGSWLPYKNNMPSFASITYTTGT